MLNTHNMLNTRLALLPPLVTAAIAMGSKEKGPSTFVGTLAGYGGKADEADIDADRFFRAVEPGYQARLASLREEFEQARSKSVGSDDLAQVAEASTSGRLDGATGRIELANPSDPHVADLLDDLGELVAKKGGTVLVIPAERMPSRTGLAAIYRY